MEEFLKKNADFFRKLAELVYDATIGLVKSYQEKTVTLAKLHVAQLYMKFVQNVRKHVVLVAVGIFAVIVSAVGIVAIPLALILMSDLSRGWKLASIGILGIFTVVIPLTVFFTVFSEKTWLKLTKSRQFMEDTLSES